MNIFFLELRSKQQFCIMRLLRCEPQLIFGEISLLLRPNLFFFLTPYSGECTSNTLFDAYKVELDCLYICHQLSVFPHDSLRICPIKLKIGMLYQMKRFPILKTFHGIFPNQLLLTQLGFFIHQQNFCLDDCS